MKGRKNQHREISDFEWGDVAPSQPEPRHVVPTINDNGSQFNRPEGPKASELSVDAATIAPPTEPCIFPHLMSLAAPTVVKIPADLLRDLRILPMVLACTAASRGLLEPFGYGAGLPVTVLMGQKKRESEDHFALSQIQARVSHQPMHDVGLTKPVRLMHQLPGGPLVTDQEGRRTLEAELPEGGILIIYDLPEWSDSEIKNTEARGEVMAWLADLSARKQPIVVFEPSAPLEDGLAAFVDPDDVMVIEHDPAAPHGHGGGGCVLRRERRGIFDELPLRWNFWYRVQESVLRWGMEVRDDDDTDSLTEQERKVLLRQIDVAKGLKQGIAQNKLADELKVSASTICRDVKELKKAGRLP